MCNFILYNNNFKLIKKFGNPIINHLPNMHLVGIISNRKDALSLLHAIDVNLIVLHISDYQSKYLHPVLKNIQNRIVFCDTSSLPKSTNHTIYVSLNDSTEALIKKVFKFQLQFDEKLLQEKVIHHLQNLKFDLKSIGSIYLIDAIIYSYFRKDSFFCNNLEKTIYPHVANKYNVSSQNIKWSIIRAINNIKSKVKASDFKDYNIDISEKITAKLLITEIVNRL